MRCSNSSDEELRAIGIFPRVCHGEQARLVVPPFKVLVCEFHTVYRFATRAVASREVSSLQHEVVDDSMECRSLISQVFARAPPAFLSSTKATEIFCGLRH